MALDNFIPAIWSENLHQAKETKLVAVGLANRSFEGEIRRIGDRVKINMFSDPTISDYTKDTTVITPENLSATQRELLIDQSKMFAFEVDDIDKAQGNVSLIEPLRRAGYKLANTADEYLLGLYAQALMARNSAENPVDLTSANVEEELLAIQETLDDNDVEQDGRFIIAPSWVCSKIVLAGLTTKSMNDALYGSGFLDRIFDFDIYKSKNVYATSKTTWAGTACLVGIAGESLGYAEQIVKVEAYRPDNSFSDAVKGLHLYGGKIMRPDKTLVWYANKTAEA